MDLNKVDISRLPSDVKKDFLKFVSKKNKYPEKKYDFLIQMQGS